MKKKYAIVSAVYMDVVCAHFCNGSLQGKKLEKSCVSMKGSKFIKMLCTLKNDNVHFISRHT